MIGISFTFLARRYHATPWGRHVNEGGVEWPPSPWRVLRSLVAVWKRTLPEASEAEMRPIFETLAAPPRFVFASVSAGHTRHYMPIMKGRAATKTKVFDTFVALAPEDAGIDVVWPEGVLSEEQRGLLARVLGNVNYLGRAESWCEARLLSPEEADAALRDEARHHAVPLAEDVRDRSDVELVRTLCPDPATAFDDRHVVEEKVVAQGRGKKKTVTRVRRPVYEPNWHLCMETLRLHDQGWSDPPGSRWVTYARPRTCFEVTSASRPARRSKGRVGPVHVARFALDGNVLPLVTDTLPVAELARVSLMSIHGRLTEVNGERGRSPVFAGKDSEGHPLAGHRHAFYLPTDEDGDGFLDHLTVYAADGFGEVEVRALRKLERMVRGEGRQPLRAVLLHLGSVEGCGARLNPVGMSAAWISATPYLATRHPKTRGAHRVDRSDPAARDAFLVGDLKRQIELAWPELADRVTIEPIVDDHGRYFVPGTAGGAPARRPLQFKRFRRKATDDGGRRPAGAFRLRFPSPIRGPVALGHSSHFGLGLFVPIREEL